MSTNYSPIISIPAISFAAPIRYTTGDKPTDVVVGLLGNNQFPSLIVANEGSRSLTVFNNNGKGVFQSSISYPSFGNSVPLALSVATINNDTYGDVVAITNSSVVVFISNENGTLQTPTFYTNNGWQSLSAVAIGTIDSDYDNDVVITDATTDKLYVVHNDGTGILNNQTPASFSTGTRPIALTLADVNKDGKLDAVVVNNDNVNTPTLSVLMNNGTGGFTLKKDYTLAAGALDVTTADLNGDGWLDVVVALSTAEGKCGVLLNKGNGTFNDMVSYSAGAWPLGVAVGLLDSDTRADIALATSGAPTFAVLQNNGNATFKTPNTFPVVSTIDTPKPTDIAIADLNGDGKNDIAVTSEYLDSVSVLINTSAQKSTFTEQTPCVVAPTLELNDPENSWIDGWLHLAITKNYEVGDDLVLPTTFNEESDPADFIWFDENIGAIRVGNAANIGRYEIKAEDRYGKKVGEIEIHFTNAKDYVTQINYTTNEWVTKVARAILFTNPSDNPSTAEREITIKAIDSASLSATTTQRITIERVNDAPQELFIDGVPIVGQTLSADTSTFSDADGLNKANITWQWLRNGVNITGATHSEYTVKNDDLGKSLTLQATYRDGSGNNEVATVTTATVQATNTAPTITLPAPVTFTNETLTTFTSDTLSLPLVGALDFNHDDIIDLVVAKSSSATGNSLVVLQGNGNGSFTQHNTYTLGNDPSAIAFGDFNGDNRPDIAITNKGSNSLSLLQNNGNGYFSASSNGYGVINVPTALTIADFNNDGITDIVVANNDNNSFAFLTGNDDGSGSGNGTFRGESIATAAAPYGIVTADFNGDGKSDIAYSDSTNNRIVVRTYSNGSWDVITTASVGNAPRALVTADFNGDGTSDIATINSADNNLSVLLNKGNGTFEAAATCTAKSNATTLTALLASDVDSDGFADLLVSHNTGVSLLLNNGSGSNGTFSTAQEIESNRFTNPPLALATADINSDTTLDVVLDGSTNTVKALYNNPRNTTTPFVEQTPIPVASSITISDVNGDTSWHGGTLQVKISNNATKYDELTLPTEKPELGGVWIDSEASNALMVYDQQTDTNLQIGTADNTSVSNNSTWTFTFNRYATNTLVQQVAQSITFSNNRDNPSPTTRAVLFTTTDSLGASSEVTQEITIQAVVDAPLTLISATPTDGAGNVGVGNNLSFTFSEEIVFGSGSIELHRDAPNGTLIERYDVTNSSNLAIEGSTLTIDPNNQLAYNTHYYVTFCEGTIDNGYGTTFSSYDYDFSTQADPYAHSSDGDGGSSTGTMLIGAGSLALLALAFL